MTHRGYTPTRLQHSPAAFFRGMQMSRFQLFAFVEGKTDSFFTTSSVRVSAFLMEFRTRFAGHKSFQEVQGASKLCCLSLIIFEEEMHFITVFKGKIQGLYSLLIKM